MDDQEYRAELKRLGLSVRGSGKFLGVDERTTRRYAKPGSRVPEPVARLLRASSPEDVKRPVPRQPLMFGSDQAD